MRSFVDFRRKVNEQEDLEVDTTELDPAADLEMLPVPPSEPTSKKSDINGIFKSLVQFHVQLRIFHWQTFSLSEHNGAGMTYDSFDEIMDKLVESYQGYMGEKRINFSGSIDLINHEEIKKEEWLSSVSDSIQELRQITEKNFNNPSDLLNIMDELLGAISKFRYLLTLK